MSTKLLKALPCLLLCASAELPAQFFVDFHPCGTLAWRLPPSAQWELSSMPAVGIGIGTRLRSFFAPSLDVLLTGVRYRRHSEVGYLLWGELHYRLLLQLRYRRHPVWGPNLAIEWVFPVIPRSSDSVRHVLRTDLAVPRFGHFLGLSLPLARRGRYVHLALGGQWLLRHPQVLRHAFLPELRLVWEGR